MTLMCFDRPSGNPLLLGIKAQKLTLSLTEIHLKAPAANALCCLVFSRFSGFRKLLIIYIHFITIYFYELILWS